MTDVARVRRAVRLCRQPQRSVCNTKDRVGRVRARSARSALPGDVRVVGRLRDDRAMTTTARGTFEVSLTPGSPELDGRIARFDLRKTFAGDIEGTAAGVMLSAGDPATGSAGYVAVEVVDARIGDRRGTFAMQQFGQLAGGAQVLHYEVVPGSGTGAFTGISGRLELTIDDGVHRYVLSYDLG